MIERFRMWLVYILLNKPRDKAEVHFLAMVLFKTMEATKCYQYRYGDGDRLLSAEVGIRGKELRRQWGGQNG